MSVRAVNISRWRRHYVVCFLTGGAMKMAGGSIVKNYFVTSVNRLFVSWQARGIESHVL